MKFRHRPVTDDGNSDIGPRRGHTGPGYPDLVGRVVDLGAGETVGARGPAHGVEPAVKDGQTAAASCRDQGRSHAPGVALWVVDLDGVEAVPGVATAHGVDLGIVGADAGLVAADLEGLDA